MVLEALAIIGAVSGTVSTINTVKGWVGELRTLVRDSKKAGETLQILHDSLDVHQTDLSIWMDLWGLQQPNSRRYQRELWGTQCMNTIARLYASINSSLDQTKTDLASILRAAGMLQQRRDNNKVGSILVVDFRQEATDAQKKLSIKEIIGFANSQGPALSKRLLEIRDKIVSIRALSVNAYAAKHRVSISNALTVKQVEEARTSVLLQMALETRHASTGLYQSYRESASPSASDIIRLGIDLIDDNAIDLDTTQSRNNIVVRYHLLVPWRSRPQKPLEFLIEGPFEPEQVITEATSRKDRGFLEACYAALLDASSEFKIQCPTEFRLFRSRTPLESQKLLSSTADWINLTKLLYNLDINIADEPSLEFPRSQRIRLAYKLVQCGMLISGTSWLSRLENQVVKRTPRDEDNIYHFLLELPAVRESLSEGSFWAISQHIFAVGKLLVELGLGRLVSKVSYRPGSYNPDPDISNYAPGRDAGLDGTNLTGAEWQSQLSIIMGLEYTGAVKHCLAKKTKPCWNNVHDVDLTPQAREIAYKEILEDYYTEVYMP